MSPLLVLALSGCPDPAEQANPGTPAAPARTTYTVAAADTLPQVAPGVVLLATLAADDTIEVSGSIVATLWEDIDGADDDRYAFRYRLLDEAGTPLYTRSTSGPVIVREFLAYYGDSSGYDILGVFPELGSFAVQVPLLEGATTVEFQLRQDDGTYATVGEYDLGRVEADDVGLSDTVSDTALLHEGGDPAQVLDIVILPDGYQESELDAFHRDAASVSRALLAQSPYSAWAGQVNVHRVDVPSAESGASYDCVGTCEWRDTAFVSVFPLEIVNRLFHTAYRTEAVFQRDQFAVARAASHVPWDIALVLVNTSHFGGFAVHYATATTGAGSWAVRVHELSHVIGQLGDEYQSDDCIRSDALGLPANISASGTAPPWMHWVEDDTPLPTTSSGSHQNDVGTFAGAYNCRELFRPAASCAMNQSGGEFCPVCAEAISRRLFRFADPATDGTAEADAEGATRFALTGVIEGATVRWTLDGAEVGTGESLLLTPADVPDGSHLLVGTASVESALVREDGGDLSASWSWRLE